MLRSCLIGGCRSWFLLRGERIVQICWVAGLRRAVSRHRSPGLTAFRVCPDLHTYGFCNEGGGGMVQRQKSSHSAEVGFHQVEIDDQGRCGDIGFEQKIVRFL
jgi:hypothetical protein